MSQFSITPPSQMQLDDISNMIQHAINSDPFVNVSIMESKGYRVITPMVLYLLYSISIISIIKTQI